ncbi:MAG: hypothetical protein F4123_04305 [Gemmatimonadetes bacterium]|nr:hypothetical protein [Gemmatimonadota bacterium]MYB97179.1 hypothetical protein [Gemmatimonadota bacterium]MYI45590.1 hypothetical protein [Gemmatimonadota bacterium]
MARHNRLGQGVDQYGFTYRINYPPDWLDRIRITRRLPSGRQSTRTLFRNPARKPQGDVGGLIRVTIESAEQGLEVGVSFRAPSGRVNEIEVHWQDAAGPPGETDRVSFRLTGFHTV